MPCFAQNGIVPGRSHRTAIAAVTLVPSDANSRQSVTNQSPVRHQSATSHHQSATPVTAPCVCSRLRRRPAILGANNSRSGESGKARSAALLPACRPLPRAAPHVLAVLPPRTSQMTRVARCTVLPGTVYLRRHRARPPTKAITSAYAHGLGVASRQLATVRPRAATASPWVSS